MVCIYEIFVIHDPEMILYRDVAWNMQKRIKAHVTRIQTMPKHALSKLIQEHGWDVLDFRILDEDKYNYEEALDRLRYYTLLRGDPMCQGTELFRNAKDYQKHKEKRRKAAAARYKKLRVQKLAYAKQRVMCACGKDYAKSARSKHVVTRHHLEWLEGEVES